MLDLAPGKPLARHDLVGGGARQRVVKKLDRALCSLKTWF